MEPKIRARVIALVAVLVLTPPAFSINGTVHLHDPSSEHHAHPYTSLPPRGYDGHREQRQRQQLRRRRLDRQRRLDDGDVHGSAASPINVTAPFSFFDAQQTYAACSPTAPGVQHGRYITWKSTSALGNGLNIFAQTMLYALISGRQIVVGHGRVPELLCSPEMGAFECGLPFHTTFLGGEYDALEKRKNSPQWHWEDVFDKKVPVHVSAIKWYAWKSVQDNIYFGRSDLSTQEKNRDKDCVFKAMRCQKGDTHLGRSGRADQYML